MICHFQWTINCQKILKSLVSTCDMTSKMGNNSGITLPPLPGHHYAKHNNNVSKWTIIATGHGWVSEWSVWSGLSEWLITYLGGVTNQTGLIGLDCLIVWQSSWSDWPYLSEVVLNVWLFEGLIGLTCIKHLNTITVTTMSNSGSYPVTPVASQHYSSTPVALTYSGHGRAVRLPLSTTLGLYSIHSLPHLTIYPVCSWVLRVLNISCTLYHFHQTWPSPYSSCSLSAFGLFTCHHIYSSLVCT